MATEKSLWGKKNRIFLLRMKEVGGKAGKCQASGDLKGRAGGQGSRRGLEAAMSLWHLSAAHPSLSE